MQRRGWTWILLCLALLGGALLLWRAESRKRSGDTSKDLASSQSTVKPGAAPQAPSVPQPVAAAEKATATGSEFPYRLTNTKQNADELLRNDRGILLENALIDTGGPLNLAIPDALKAPADNGTYIVQARGEIDDQFRKLLRQVEAEVVSYVPVRAELVRVTAAGAQQLAANPLVQAVLPYEPYYKLDPTLLKLAVETGKLSPEIGLNLMVFGNAREATLAQLQELGAEVAAEQRSSFGTTTLLVYPAQGTFLDVTRLPGVMRVEQAHERVTANDLLRVRLGGATNSSVATGYLGLTGSGITINVNDSGADQTHPDLAGRLSANTNTALSDPNGHGTHVVGTIIGNGSQSGTVGTNASGSASNANFRGMAPSANAFVIGIGFNTKPRPGVGAPASDADLQEEASRTNVFISNNSWNYGGAATYDMFAASYDAAVRDADPSRQGSQPLLYVFSAGNGGAGNEAGKGGAGNSIWSPGTAKNVITVGAVEQRRNITNKVIRQGTTNAVFQAGTDSSNQVSSYSGRGNVGIGIEGEAGRYKPDLVAPGNFVLSTKSANWDQAAYFDPTNHTFNTSHNLTVDTNGLLALSLLVPENAISVTISTVPNNLSLLPFPDMPIYVKVDDNPTTTVFDVKSNNTVTLTTGDLLVPGGSVFYSIEDGTNRAINFNVITEVVTTNDQGDYLTVLSNMNSSLGPYYRYESGTSMAAAGVSGMLALMQEFFEQRMGVTNSPALMKALLINGARPISGAYDFQVGSVINYQGWGLPNLSNSIPGILTNGGGTNINMPVQYFDQSLSNSLATGQSKTWNLKLSTNVNSQPLRVTLVWTDPPGNPAVGVKLVNDLDLIVTNKDTTNVFWGNDIPAGSSFNQPSATNDPNRNDLVNNVENVFLQPPLGTNYSITVRARRVNVNAVTANTNDVVQDFALVISRGDGGTVSNAFTLTDIPIASNNVPYVQVVSNGLPIFGQRVGANSQYATLTNGITNQWNFYVFTNAATNSATFTNVAFVTYAPPNIGVPRIGTRETSNVPNGTRAEADLDMYVSTDPDLTNLTASVVNAAAHSLTRTGTERVLLSNSSPGTVYYVAVKSEDRQGADYAFVAVATSQPFGQRDGNGNVVLTVITPPLPAPIPPGQPSHPGSVSILALTTEQVQVRKVVVTDTISHVQFGDLIGAFSHGQKSVVLNNHTFFTNTGNAFETFVYDDSGEQDSDFPGARPTDGPGSLRDFVGEEAASGVWILSMVNDSSLSDTGTVDALSAVIVPQPDTNSITETIPANSWVYGFIDVPVSATNLTINVNVTTPDPVQLYLRRDNFPDVTHFDKATVINNGSGSMILTVFDSPPLNPGRYYFGVFNPNINPVTVTVAWSFGFSLTGVQPLRLESIGNEPILDDAVTDSTINVGLASRVVSVEAGVRLDHPRESDLTLTLISPSGTRVLLAENRGGIDGNGYGAGTVTTNFFPTNSAGSGALAFTNDIDAGVSQGTLIINYDMLQVPDDIRVYYDGVRIFDSGTISGVGTFSIDFGPGASTHLIIIVNEGDNADPGTSWSYSASVITRQAFYATFTEDTNLTTMPIKFATPPFGTSAAVTPPVTNLISDFEVTATNYAGPGTNIDNWAILDTNVVTVVNVPVLAAAEGNAFAGANVLALHSGHLSRTLPTIAGRSYTLSFAYHGRPDLTPVSWWKGEAVGTSADSVDGNGGALVNGAGSGPGLVGQGLNLAGTAHVRVPDAPNLHFTTNITMEAWVFRARTSTEEHIISKWDAVPFKEQRSYSMAIWPDDKAFINIDTDGTANPGSQTAVFSISSVPSNQWVYLATTYDGINARVYFNGILETTVNFPGAIFPGTNDFAIGGTVGGDSLGNVIHPFAGKIDEATVYNRVLSDLQIQDIYAAGSAGKRLSEPPVSGGYLLDSAVHLLAGDDTWKTNTLTFTAPSNGTVLELVGGDDGMLYDTFVLVENPHANPANYFLPEESLNKFVGENSQGDWKLEIWDNRAGATNPTPNLISWQLSLVLDRLVPTAIPLTHAIPNTNTVAGNSMSYYLVDVPLWAKFATNTLTTPGGPLLLYFNQNQLPGTNGGDVLLQVAFSGAATAVLDTTTSAPLLLPGQRYYLGVQNPNPGPMTFTIEVDFDITTLTNAIALTNTLGPTTVPRYYQYDVSSNAVAVAFEVLQPSGNVTLVARRGPPLPDELSFDYRSANPGTNEERIVVATNSTPVPLAPGRWYLGVFNHALAPSTYAIRATEFGLPIIIQLTNDITFTTNFPPGPSLDVFFQFDITQSNAAALFELVNLNGNVDLTLKRGALPYSPPYFATSANPGSNNEQIVVRTNILGTNINGSWFLGVPNNSTNNVTFTIHAVVDTNGILPSAVPPDPVVIPAPGAPTFSWPSVVGEKYDVQRSPTLFPTVWTTIATITATSATTTFTDPSPIPPPVYYRIVQVP